MILAEIIKKVYNLFMLRKQNNGKNPIVGTIIAAFCIVVYFVVLISAILRIYSGMDQRRIEAELEFYDLADLTLSSGRTNFGDEIFIEIIQKKLMESRTLEGIIITSSRGEYSFEKEPGKAINMVNGFPKFKHRLGFSRQQLYRPLQIEGLRNVNIEARASAFDYASLIEVLKQTLLLITIALALAFFTLLFESLLRGQAWNAGFFGKKNAQEKPEKSTGENNADAAAYSQRGSVIKEEYTESRLKEELRRCEEGGHDLAFIAIEFKPFADDSFYARFAADAARFFSSRDFVCEKGERGISVICPGLNLDAGFLNAGEFHSRVMGKYPSFFKSKTELCMGLSARSERPVNAQRLIFEAEESLERAMLDPVSHIVAFKSDPEKYRAFMEGRDEE